MEFIHIDNEQCSAYELPIAEIIIHELPSISHALPDDSICSGQMIDLNIEANNSVGLFEVALLYNNEIQNITLENEPWNSSFFPKETFSITIGPIEDLTTGCVDTNVVQISAEVIAFPSISLNEDLSVCSGDNVLIGTPFEQGVEYQWSSASNMLTPDSSSTYIILTNEETETTIVEVILIASRSGCLSEEGLSITLDPLQMVNFTYNPQPVTAVNPIINLYNLTAGSNDYIWTLDGDTLADELNISWLLEEGAVDDYFICLEAISSFSGCKNSYCEVIEVVDDMSIYIPNSFSPDGDGINEDFGPEIQNADLRFYIFDIYDRGGSKAFSTNDIDSWWNGTEMNIGQMSRTGLYNYVLITRDKFSRDPTTVRGTVTLIR